MHTLLDLNEVLFSQLEKLSSAEKKEDIEAETVRSSSMVNVSKQIIDNAKTLLDAQIAVGETISSTSLPPMLNSKDSKENR